jgi:hypothetical protein
MGAIEDAWEAVGLEAGAYRDFAFMMGWHGDDICKVDAEPHKLKAAVRAAMHAAVEDAEMRLGHYIPGTAEWAREYEALKAAIDALGQKEESRAD